MEDDFRKPERIGLNGGTTLHFHFQVHHFLQQYGYGGVFFVLLVEMIGIPFPAETTLTLSGIEWKSGVFQLVYVLGAAAAGNVVGSSIAYWIGRSLGRPVILRYGRYVGITEPRLNAAEEKFQRLKVPVLLIAKFIAGIRVLVPYLAGINKMNFLAFSFYNTISALIWSATFIVVGRYLVVAWEHYHKLLRHYYVPIAIVVVVLFGIYFYWRARKKKKESA